MQYMKIMNMDRVRMREVGTRMEREQRALLDTKDGMTKLMAKGTSDLWRLKQRMECLLKGFKTKFVKPGTRTRVSWAARGGRPRQ